MDFTGIKEMYIPEGKVKLITFPNGSSYEFSESGGGQITPDYSQEYLTIESLEDNNTIRWQNIGSGPKTIYYSTNKTSWTSLTSTSRSVVITILNTGDKVYIKGENTGYASDGSNYNYFLSSNTLDLYGNIMSLIYGDNFVNNTTITTEYTFTCLFRGLKVVDASNLILPALTLSYSCYSDMFNSCNNLVSAPALPATTLAGNCYIGMFVDCDSLVNAPVLVAAAPLDGSYAWMFKSCVSLRYIKVMATSRESNSFYYWLEDISGNNGVIEKYSTLSLPTNSYSGIPSGWTTVAIS